MTTSPESRAKEIHDRLFRLGKYHFEKVHMDPLEFIASAIREAENAKLEEVATHYEKSESLIAQQMADTIRTFKSKD